jgi:hypothetical protein
MVFERRGWESATPHTDIDADAPLNGAKKYEGDEWRCSHEREDERKTEVVHSTHM